MKKKELKCVYCGCLIEWGSSCEPCGHKEDVALGKVDGDVLDAHQNAVAGVKDDCDLHLKE